MTLDMEIWREYNHPTIEKYMERCQKVEQSYRIQQSLEHYFNEAKMRESD
jgi:hypothetical protein